MYRIPADRPLAEWIRQLESAGKAERFYHTREWRELRADVLRDHPLCEDCCSMSPHERMYRPVNRAVYVHHVNEVHDRPDLALSRTWTDADGEHCNLVALCFNCHERRHGRLHEWSSRKNRVTVERFD